MQNALGIYSRCLFLRCNAECSVLTLHYTTRRFRSAVSRRKPSARPQDLSSIWKPQSYSQEESKNAFGQKPRIVEKPQLSLSPENPREIIDYFQNHVERWSEGFKLKERLKSFGVPQKDIKPLLRHFVRAVCAGELSSPEAYNRYNLVRFGLSSEDDFPDEYTDIVMTGILYNWISDPTHQKTLESIIPLSTITSMRRLFEATRNEYPANMYPAARRIRRKVYMHVGPTNSGKTHNALRALAASESGVYAGPLRLLAHEIWDRLNRGQIVPLGAEEDPVKAPPPLSTAVAAINSALDVAPAPSASRSGNPKYARACNMLTGEEHKIVDPMASLLSCTVEMLNTVSPFDVGVIDEIQMIADPQRGFAWTHAVLGLCAKELHLCGEETAVPIIKELLKDTDDELIVKRYQRLTPLSTDNPLGGDYTKVQKGDCIVTFSRTGIFSVKRKVEKATGLRCAVVYGKLPPELRSEQAELFNDPDSGYDVIVGSDAIGMGLNLKIRRVIFEKVAKFNGKELEYLSLSQTRQIAGRAGRYGMMQDEKPGGFVTCLNTPDIQFIKEKLAETPKPIPTARLGPSSEASLIISQALPPNCGLNVILDAQVFVGKAPPKYRYSGAANSSQIAEKIDKWAAGLSLEVRTLLLLAPMPWRDPASLNHIQKLVETYRDCMYVGLMDLLEGSPFMDDLEFVENQMATLPTPSSNATILSSLESFHKFLGVYSWLAFRAPVSFSDVDEAVVLKERLERALHWALEGVTRNIDEYHQLKQKRAESGIGQEKISFITNHELKRKGLGLGGAIPKPIRTPASKVVAAQKKSRASLSDIASRTWTSSSESL